MAISGVALFGFVVVHMLGNMNLYLGPQAMYDYAVALRKIPGGLWVARAVLLGALVAHVVSMASLRAANAAARPAKYHTQKTLASNYAAKTMYVTGPLIMFYVGYHIAHITFGVPHPSFDGYNPYNNVVYGLQHPLVATLYIAANLCLGFHLFHGVWSMFQSLGLNHPRYNHYRKQAAVAFAVIVTAGNLSFVICVLLGILEPTTMTFEAW